MAAASKLVTSLRQDLRLAWRHTVLNTLAGGVWVPRAVRVLLYRAMGIRALGANIAPGSRFTGTDVVIGRGTFVNTGALVDVGRQGSVRIGERCNLGPQVALLGQTHEVEGDGRYRRRSEHRPVVVGDDVWLGARSTVLPGVTVGDGCIVAAGAVVSRDIGPGGVWAGVPARRVERASDGPDADGPGRTDEVVVDPRDGVDPVATGGQTGTGSSRPVATS